MEFLHALVGSVKTAEMAAPVTQMVAPSTPTPVPVMETATAVLSALPMSTKDWEPVVGTTARIRFVPNTAIVPVVVRMKAIL